MASGSEDGILIRSMKLEEFKEVKTLLGNSFYTEEPLCKCRGKTMEHDHRKEHDDYLISRIAMLRHSWASDVQHQLPNQVCWVSRRRIIHSMNRQTTAKCTLSVLRVVHVVLAVVRIRLSIRN